MLNEIKWARWVGLCLAGGWLMATPLFAATITNVAGGDFQTAANWSPAVVPGLSDTNDTAIFNRAGPYTVMWSENISNANFKILQGTVTFDLQGHTYTYNNANGSYVGVDGQADLTITNGSLVAAGPVVMTYVQQPGSVLRIKGAYMSSRYYRMWAAAPGATMIVDGNSSTGYSWGYNDVGSGANIGHVLVTNEGTLNFGSLNLTYGDVIVTGTNSLCTVSSGTIVGNSSGSTGSLYVYNGAFLNRGSSIATRILTIWTNGTVTLSNGTFALSGVNAELRSYSGLLQGSGVITGYFQNAGTVRPGGSNGIGTLSFTGQFYNGDTNETTNGAIEFDLGGTASNQYDQIVVNGLLTAKGALTVNWINGFLPQSGNRFRIFQFTSVAGAFDTVNLPRGANHWDLRNLYVTGEIRYLCPGTFISIQ